MKSKKIKVGITHGDINGIGYEVILKTLSDNNICDICIPIVYGSSKIAAYYRRSIGLDNFSFNLIKHPNECNPKRPNLINVLSDEYKAEPGRATPQSGKAALISLERATEDLKRGFIDVLVTAPIDKMAINSKDFNFPGHTEYLQNKFNANNVLMFMISENLKMAIATGHIPLKEVPSKISTELILQKLRLLNQTLLKDFGINKPKIAVLGLNPHAGDGGLIGNEEKEIIYPALTKAREEKILAMGPFPADGFFGAMKYKKYDAVLAMYHDQGLIPFKYIAFNEGVNFTAGLPVVRTSPAHGTAFDIADKNLANPSPFRAAMFLAIDIYKKREEYNELTKNPLEITKKELTNE